MGTAIGHIPNNSFLRRLENISTQGQASLVSIASQIDGLEPRYLRSGTTAPNIAWKTTSTTPTDIGDAVTVDSPS